jgi:hypothetical protein
MNTLTLMRFVQTSCAALSLVLVLATGSAVDAQIRAGVGLITAVDIANHTLVVETRSGVQYVKVPPTAPIRGDHGEGLSLRDLRPGDAVSYQPASDNATSLRVARQFWAIPREW